MKKLLLNIRLFFMSLFRGMKSADELIMNGEKNASAGDPVQEQKTETQSLYAALLRGEVTQEVKDLRYEMYESVRKSKDFKAVGWSGKAVKKNHMLEKSPMKIDEEDGLKVILIQDNKVELDGQNTSVENAETLRKVRVEADAKHKFKATHEYRVRHKIESYAKKLVVKKTDEENKFKLDFYLSQYPVENDPRAVYVIKELESLYNSGSRTSDLTDLITITFTTDKAYGDDDWKIYDFTIRQYAGIKKFDGNYIISFYASLPETGVVDVSEQFKDSESVKKFKEKAPRKNKTITIKDAKELIERKDEKFDEKKAGDMAKKIKNKKKQEK